MANSSLTSAFFLQVHQEPESTFSVYSAECAQPTTPFVFWAPCFDWVNFGKRDQRTSKETQMNEEKEIQKQLEEARKQRRELHERLREAESLVKKLEVILTSLQDDMNEQIKKTNS